MFTVLDRLVPPCSYKRQYITEIKRICNTKFDTKVPKVTRRHDVTSDASCTRFARSSGAVEQWSTEDLLQSMCLPCWRRPKPWWRSLAELRIVPWTVSSLSAHCQLHPATQKDQVHGITSSTPWSISFQSILYVSKTICFRMCPLKLKTLNV